MGGPPTGRWRCWKAVATPIWAGSPSRIVVRPMPSTKASSGHRGELLGWLNGDDEYVSEAVDQAVAPAPRKPDLDAVFGGMDYHRREGGCAVSTGPRVQLAPLSLPWRLPADADDHLPSPPARGGRATRRELRGRRRLRLLPAALPRRAGRGACRRRWCASATTRRARPRATLSGASARRFRSASNGGAARPAAPDEGDGRTKRLVLPRISPGRGCSRSLAPMRITLRHHFDFGADRPVVGDDLVRPEAWDALGHGPTAPSRSQGRGRNSSARATSARRSASARG